MKFVALLSGGKDSIYATLEAIENGHELICCAHLAPSTQRNKNLEEESYMYQTAGSEAVRFQVEECMGLPFYVREICGHSKNIALVYDTSDESVDTSSLDEVEDLYLLLKEIQRNHPDVLAVSSGAILSTYQRTRIEHVCSRLNLTSLSYLWRITSQMALLDSILDIGQIDAVLVRVACPPGLMPHQHLGKSLRELRDSGVLHQLQNRYGMHPAGEGGEYETLVLDCPRLFKLGTLKLEETEVVCDVSDDGVGILKIIKCSVIKKTNSSLEESNNTAVHRLEKRIEDNTGTLVKIAKDSIPSDYADIVQIHPIQPELMSHIHQSINLPSVRMMKGGLCYISALMCPIVSNQLKDESAAAVDEYLAIQQMLIMALSRLYPGDQPPTSTKDILYVHLYLSEMSHFIKINQHYQQFFGLHLPPSRSCVAVGKGALPGGRRVMMDCMLQRGSGAYLRNTNCKGNLNECNTFLDKTLQNKQSFLRKTLHVQSISHWAPVCIGPYSQANALRSSIVFLAGMIGLVPETMKLVEPESFNMSSFEVQLYQSWKNAAAVLDGLDDGGGNLDDCVGGLVYVSIGALESMLPHEEIDDGSNIPWQKLWDITQKISNHAVSTNAGVLMGSIDGISTNNRLSNIDSDLYDENGLLYGGYEDEETWKEMTGSTKLSFSSPNPSDNSLPLLMVCLPELPAKAHAEVELIVASRRAASCLGVFTGSLARSLMKISQDRNVSTSDLSQAILWETGYDHTHPQKAVKQYTSCIEISSIARLVGRGCACVTTVVAKIFPCENDRAIDMNEFDIDFDDVLSRMIDASINNAKVESDLSSLFTIDEVLNVRLYYLSASIFRRGNKKTAGAAACSFEIEVEDDGSCLRTRLHAVLQMKANQFHNNIKVDQTCKSMKIPAYTLVPVLGIEISCEKNRGTAILAMQVTMADITKMETDVWVRYNRQY